MLLTVILLFCYFVFSNFNIFLASQTNRCLSFAWLVWDVLACVKKQYILDNNIKLPLDPLGVSLTKHIDSVIHSTDDAIKARISGMFNILNTPDEKWDSIRGYCETHKGIFLLFTFLNSL